MTACAWRACACVTDVRQVIGVASVDVTELQTKTVQQKPHTGGADGQTDHTHQRRRLTTKTYIFYAKYGIFSARST